ncbi:hypothetical protein [Pseudomonas putida]|uniref:hypothetical protein n=1 Tax=Pseudomonas putida TaxID=303 RepID=UPI0015FE378B|nr:hypothetical protein [Pseudomonas putida]
MKKKISTEVIAFQPLPDEYIGSTLRREAELFDFDRGEYAPIKRAEIKCARLLANADRRESIDHAVAFATTLYPLCETLGFPRKTELWVPVSPWKICVDCAMQNFSEFGVSYLHRIGAVRRVRVCPRHCCFLLEICPSCGKRYSKHSILNIHSCLDVGPNGRSERTGELGEEREFSVFVQGVLDNPYRKIEQKAVFEAVYQALVSSGYAMGGVGVRKIHREIDRRKVYQDCCKVIPQGMKMFEWREGCLSLGSLLALTYFTFREVDVMYKWFCMVQGTACVEAACAGFPGQRNALDWC